MVSSKKFFQPIDTVALTAMLVLSVLILILLWSGDHTTPRVRAFSWQDKLVSADDAGFILTFSRPMNHASVEENLRINPPIPGKISWAGRRMAYTPLNPVPYGGEYQLQLEKAIDQFSTQRQGESMELFTASFRTRDRAFAYIGVEGKEKGRLILYNLTQQKKTVLTPSDLVVTDFKPYPDGERILFSATTANTQEQNLLSRQLYNVTTGISFRSSQRSSSSTPAPGILDLVLDDQEYQNLKFDLSADGQTIVVQRVKRGELASGLEPWIIKPNAKSPESLPQPLGAIGGDFVITPDSNSLALLKGKGTAILPLSIEQKSSTNQQQDFLPQFGQVLSFARDGSQAAMVSFNEDNPQLRYIRSLFLVANHGLEQELLRTKGLIKSCEFSPNQENLYCLLTDLTQGEQYLEEQPFLVAINLKMATTMDELPQQWWKQPSVKWVVPLVHQQDIHMSLSPDGLALLFDQVFTSIPSANDTLKTDEGQAIATSLLWLLPLDNNTAADNLNQLKPEQLLPGFHPRWLR
ncbi:MAG: Ig-like domain-containing protein [Symploca sp. SIO3C6]|nr:Ig-like domain-containing protein [Symploca sp. SIO3C6]NET05081.1 Ig-like domain-containing protein [Symploca sp. SIO2B6]